MLFGGTALVCTILIINYGHNAAQLSVSSNSRRPTILYRAPSNYRSSFKKENSVPAPFIITSRPLMFTNTNEHTSGESTGHSIKHKTKVSLFSYVPGMATIFCKGLSCGHNSNTANTNNDAYHDDDDDSGFPGEAIAIEPSEQFMTVNVGSNVKTTRPIIVTNGVVQPILFQKPSTSVNNSPNTASSTLVNLMTNRPYLQRGPTTTPRPRRTTTRATTTKPSQFFRQSTTRRRTRRTTSSTTGRPLVAADSVVSATTSVGGGGGGGIMRPPSLFIPAITAFTLMALPVAAAAVPFIIQSGRRRRRAASTTSNNLREALEINQELISILDDLSELSRDEDVIQSKVNKHVQKSMSKIFNAAGNVNRRLSTISLQRKDVKMKR
ncbi:hypothetical protein CHUAL_002003 [Chamberlinius hualienensis]